MAEIYTLRVNLNMQYYMINDEIVKSYHLWLEICPEVHGKVDNGCVRQSRNKFKHTANPLRI